MWGWWGGHALEKIYQLGPPGEIRCEFCRFGRLSYLSVMVCVGPLDGVGTGTIKIGLTLLDTFKPFAAASKVVLILPPKLTTAVIVNITPKHAMSAYSRADTPRRSALNEAKMRWLLSSIRGIVNFYKVLNENAKEFMNIFGY
ncbi:MAG: hypothetical protein POH28_05195 [Acidocella sp.]|nr:hypothetical protein [Acidocella sp.]